MERRSNGKMKRASEATKARLLDAAERLFAEKGLHGASVREIAAAAGVDLAMINYHFGSKDGLYRAVFARRMEPLNEARGAELAAARARPGAPPDLDAIVAAIVDAPTRLRAIPGDAGLSYARMIVREVIDPGEQGRKILEENLDPIAVRFIAALQEALPEADPKAICWAYFFSISAMVCTMADTGRIGRVSKGLCRPEDVEDVLRHLVPFVVGGMKACAPVARAGNGDA